MNVTQPVGTTARQLAAVGVDGDHAVAGNVVTTLDKASPLAEGTQAEGFEPDHRQDREAVIKLRRAQVGRLQVGA